MQKQESGFNVKLGSMQIYLVSGMQTAAMFFNITAYARVASSCLVPPPNAGTSLVSNKHHIHCTIYLGFKAATYRRTRKIAAQTS